MDSGSFWLVVFGGMISIIGGLMVTMLGFLHVRLNRIEAKGDERSDELYRYLDRNYLRRELADAQRDTILQAFSQLNTRLDTLNQRFDLISDRANRAETEKQ